MQFERNQVVLVKLETERGVNAEPIAANAISCGIVDVTVDGKQLDDPTVRNSISAQPRKYINKVVKATIPVLIKGSGDAKTPPKISPLLQSCALKETATTTEGQEKVEYTPLNADADMKSCTVFIYIDGFVIKAVGCMAELSGNCSAGEYGVLSFSVQGKFLNAGDEANPTPSADLITAVECKNYGLNFDTYEDAVIRNFGFVTGNTLVARANVNAADGIEPFCIPARDPLYSAKIEAVLESAHSFWADYIDRGEIDMAFTHGSESGNIFMFSAARANVDAPKFSSENSIKMYDIGGQLIETTAEDNFKITFK